MKKMNNKFPQLVRPRFQLANLAAKSVLLELGNPEPPIPIERYIRARNWKIIKTELYGPDGYMMKVVRNGKPKFAIYLATDIENDSFFREDTIKRRQYFTLAHELGHILLHGGFLLNSTNMEAIPRQVSDIMEVEAHWFASRLLMPNYLFQNVVDLIPEQFAERCGVNITPAQKRLKNLSPNIRNALLKQLKFCKEYPVDDVFRSSKLKYICPECGLFHNERNIWGSHCSDCGGKLVKMTGTF